MAPRECRLASVLEGIDRAVEPQPIASISPVHVEGPGRHASAVTQHGSRAVAQLHHAFVASGWTFCRDHGQVSAAQKAG
jgi:2,4-dienoyl-CoA reductase-like NADH-dependent reductase (Old Yellow Enzyme family)